MVLDSGIDKGSKFVDASTEWLFYNPDDSGAWTNINAVSSSSPNTSLENIDTDIYVASFRNSSGFPNAIVIDISSGTPISGTPLVLASSNVNIKGIFKISTTQVLIQTDNNVHLCTISGTSIVLDDTQIATTNFAAMIQGNTTKTTFVEVRKISVSNLEGRYYTVSGTTLTRGSAQIIVTTSIGTIEHVYASPVGTDGRGIVYYSGDGGVGNVNDGMSALFSFDEAAVGGIALSGSVVKVVNYIDSDVNGFADIAQNPRNMRNMPTAIHAATGDTYSWFIYGAFDNSSTKSYRLQIVKYDVSLDIITTTNWGQMKTGRPFLIGADNNRDINSINIITTGLFVIVSNPLPSTAPNSISLRWYNPKILTEDSYTMLGTITAQIDVSDPPFVAGNGGNPDGSFGLDLEADLTKGLVISYKGGAVTGLYARIINKPT